MKAILEKVKQTEEGIHAFIYQQDSFEHPWHFHPEYELTLILQSSGIRYVGNNISDFQEGDLVLLGSNLPHCWKNADDHRDKSRSLVIQWQKETIGDLPVFRRIHHLLNKSQRGLYFHPNNRNTISNLMHQVEHENGMDRYLKFIELMDYLSQYADYELIAGASYSYDMSSDTTDRLNRVQLFVKNKFKEKIKLSEIASELSMSEQAFSRFFSKTMNKPFFEFVNEYRVNIASRHILETDLQMAEIAYKCGYESLPFFYKQFKKFKGYTPLEFRKMYRSI
ncbi:MAG: AraC family transcriptional regulator [Cyclobacteriaceae bacterium]